MANRRFIDFPIASTVGDDDIVLIWQDGRNKQTTKATILSGLPENLDQLNDVVISGLTNGQILRYDSVTGKWVNTDQGNLDLNDLNDVSIVLPSNGQVLVYNSLTSKWENSSGGFVPYVGAVTTVDLGAQGLRAGYVRFDTSVVTVPDEQGLMYWDASRSTAALIMNGTLQHIGQDTFFYVKNSSAYTIPKGTCVRFAGTDGASGHLLIMPFTANGAFPSSYFMGVTAEDIANGEFGQVMHFGELSGIDTTGYTAGALLYASSTVAGAFQTTAPLAPNNIVLVAAAVNSKVNGSIVVRPTYGSNINNDEGVKITSPTTGDLLQLQAGGLWENKTLAQVIGSAYVPSTRTITINGTAFDLSANRSWTVGDVRTDGSYSNPSWITALAWSKITGTPTTLSGYGITDAVQTSRTITINGVTQDLSANRTFNVGTVTSVTATSPLFSSGGATPNITIQQASGSQSGFLSSTDWTTFNNKQNALTNPVTGTGTTNYLPKFTGSTTVGNSQVFDNGTNVGINNASPIYILDAYSTGSGTARIRVQGTTNFVLTQAQNSSGTLFMGVDSSTADGFGLGNYSRIIYSSNAYPLVFAVNDAEAMRISSGRNLLVGTTTDNGARLQVNGTATFTGIGTFNNGTNSTNGIKIISTLTSSLFTGGLEFIRTTVNGGSKIEPLRDAAIGGVGLSFQVTANNTAEVNATYTSAMNILNNGNVLIGTTTDAGQRLQVSGSASFTGAVTANATSTFSNASNLSAIFSNGGAVSNYNSIELRGGTAGTAVNWQISKDNSAANSFELAASTTAGGTTYGSPVFRISSTGAATFSSSVTANGGVNINGYLISTGGNYLEMGSGPDFYAINAINRNSGNYNLPFFIDAQRLVLNNGSAGNVLIATTVDNGNRLRVNGVGFFDTGVRTGQPFGTTSDVWKLGRGLVAGSPIINRWIRVQIGNEYYDLLANYGGVVPS